MPFDPSWIDLEKGCTLLINKPIDWTSFDVVNKVRGSLSRYFKQKRIKVGHAGTLDPKATGLLIICVGKHTKRIQAFQQFDKSYEGTLELGKTTPTYDRESQPDAFYETQHISEQDVYNLTDQFIGRIEQIPPIYSALKVDGKIAYKAARAGQEIVLKSRKIDIQKFDIIEVNMPYVSFEVSCSKGTYIRSLAFDFGKALNSGAYLYRLHRTRIGPFISEQAYELSQVVSGLELQSN